MYSKVIKESASPVAVIMKVINDVIYKNVQSDWTAAKIGQPLSTGDEIKTGEKSLALIKFTDGSILNVREKSSLKIYADKKDKEILKNTFIENGNVEFNVNKQENEEFKFTTPTMVASIRGTEGYIGNLSDGSSILVCEKGSIDVEASLGNKQTGNIKGGQFAKVGKEGDIETGTVTEEQQKLNDKMKKSNTKKIIIKTNSGDLIIDYIAD
jgi:hypothetical protein